MKIQYLGTAAAEGIPAIFCTCELCRKTARAGSAEVRCRSSVLINDQILIDLTPDIYYQKMRWNLDLSQLEAVFVTHSHTDHFDGAELTRRSAADYCKPAWERPLLVYGNRKVCGFGRRSLREEFGMEENPSIVFHELVPYETVKLCGLTVTAIPAQHDPQEDCLIYLIEDENSRFLYGNDTGLLLEETYTHLGNKPFDLISLDCTFGARKAREGRHMGFSENWEFLQELQKHGCYSKSTKVYATHFSHNCGMLQQELEQEGSKYGIHAAYDGLICII